MNRIETPLLRDATAADADAVARIHHDGWVTGYAGLLPEAYLASLTLEPSVTRWRAQLALADRSTRERVAEVDGQVVGFATSGPCFDPDCPRERPWGEVWDFFVLDGHRGHGIGSVLLAAVLADLARAGHDEAVVWVLAGNERALATYRRAGFVEDGTARSEQRAGFTMRDVRLRARLDGSVTGQR